MSLSHSPQIVTNGLVFYYDMNSVWKSWKGKPTTNIVTNANTMSTFNNYSNGPTSTFITEFGTTGWKMSNAGSWNGCSSGISIPSSGNYTFSAWFRYWGGSVNNNGATVYVSGWGGSDSAVALDKSKVGVWQRVSMTLNITTSGCTFYLISYGGTNNADNVTWDVTMPQVEAGSFASGFVNGTRSNTQAILDLTNNNTITANSLTYSSDGTFGFNGSNDKLTLNTTPFIGTADFTLEAVVKQSSAGSTDYIVGNYGTGNNGLEYYLWNNKISTYIAGTYVPGTYTTSANIWYHVTSVRNGGIVTMYVNGVYDTSGSAPNSIPTANPFTIGNGHDYTSEAFGGTIAVVKIYNRALSADEVKQNFNALRGRYGL